MYELTHVIEEWFESGTFPLPCVWKNLIKSKIHAVESEKWHTYCAGHSKFGLAGAAFTHIFSYQYWSLAFDYPDLVKHFHLQVCTVGNFALNGVPWLDGANVCLCYIFFFCTLHCDSVFHFVYLYFSVVNMRCVKINDGLIDMNLKLRLINFIYFF